MSQLKTKDLLRFIKFLRPQENGCWLWSGSHTGGYAEFYFDGKVRQAMHFALKMAGREIPLGMEPDHLCRIRGCSNPAHLDVVTRRENVRRGNSLAGINARKTHCDKGHPFDAANTYRDKKGRRVCRKCNCTRVKALYQRDPEPFRKRSRERYHATHH